MSCYNKNLKTNHDPHQTKIYYSSDVIGDYLGDLEAKAIGRYFPSSCSCSSVAPKQPNSTLHII